MTHTLVRRIQSYTKDWPNPQRYSQHAHIAATDTFGGANNEGQCRISGCIGAKVALTLFNLAKTYITVGVAFIRDGDHSASGIAPLAVLDG